VSHVSLTDRGLAPESRLPTKYLATVEYSDHHGKSHVDQYQRDIESFKGRMDVTRKGLDDIAKALEAIGKHLRGFSSSYGGLSVVTETLDSAKQD
jgi:hypothetical protein